MAANSNSKIRLYVTEDLGPDRTVTLDRGQAHYLASVMRCRPGDRVLLFNGRDGEWRAEITDLAKKSATLHCEDPTRPQNREPDLWLLFAPVKKARIDVIAEKAGELGAARLMPVMTAYTAVSRVNTDRLAANAKEAAEQCGRLSVPAVAEPAPLTSVLADWPADRPLFFADPEGGPFPEPQSESAAGAVLIGPEGGFAEDERRRLHAMAVATPVGLGPRILRTETAVIAMLTLWQARHGDWR